MTNGQSVFGMPALDGAAAAPEVLGNRFPRIESCLAAFRDLPSRSRNGERVVVPWLSHGFTHIAGKAGEMPQSRNHIDLFLTLLKRPKSSSGNLVWGFSRGSAFSANPRPEPACRVSEGIPG
jgi:hypothetical protein